MVVCSATHADFTERLLFGAETTVDCNLIFFGRYCCWVGFSHYFRMCLIRLMSHRGVDYNLSFLGSFTGQG